MIASHLFARRGRASGGYFYSFFFAVFFIFISFRGGSARRLQCIKTKEDASRQTKNGNKHAIRGAINAAAGTTVAALFGAR